MTRGAFELKLESKMEADEAGETVVEAFDSHVKLEHSTARKLFTLIFLISNELPETMVSRHRHQ